MRKIKLTFHGNLMMRHELSRKIKNKIRDIKDPPISPPYDSEKPVAFDPLAAELPEWLPAAAWASWVLYRKEIKKTIKNHQVQADGNSGDKHAVT